MTTLRKFPRSGNLRTIGPALLYVNVKWCPHCTAARPIMERVSGILGSQVPVYSVDGDDRPDLVEALGARGFPTIVFVTGGGAQYAYEGERTVDGITSAVCQHGETYPFCSRYKR
jgi:thioredoxin-like negative regulator of GroEL